MGFALSPFLYHLARVVGSSFLSPPFLSLLSLWAQALESTNRPCPRTGNSAESLGPALPLLLVFWGTTGNFPNPHKPWCSHSLSGESVLLISCARWSDLGRWTCEHNLEGVELAGLGFWCLFSAASVCCQKRTGHVSLWVHRWRPVLVCVCVCVCVYGGWGAVSSAE